LHGSSSGIAKQTNGTSSGSFFKDFFEDLQWKKRPIRIQVFFSSPEPHFNVILFQNAESVCSLLSISDIHCQRRPVAWNCIVQTLHKNMHSRHM